MGARLTSHFFLLFFVLCVFTVVARPVEAKKGRNENLLRELKRGLHSADSILVCEIVWMLIKKYI